MGKLSSSTSTTHWNGDLLSGTGTTSLDTSGVATFDVAWAKREESGPGTTNPEELIAAAYASCYCMALAGKLAKGGHAPTSLDTSVTVRFNVGVGIDKISLHVKGDVPGLSAEEFAAEAEWAKDNCPVGAALGAVSDKELIVG